MYFNARKFDTGLVLGLLLVIHTKCDELSELQKRMNDLTEKLETRIDVLESTVIQQSEIIDDLRKEIKNESHTVKKLEATIAQQIAINNKLRDDIAQLNKAQRLSGEPVAFTAYATVDKNYDSDQVIIFDSEKSNFGNGFDSTSSAFTCPVRGLYMFSVCLMSGGGNIIEGVIEISGVDLLTVYSHNDWYQSTNIAFVECQPGEKVRVVCGTFSAICSLVGNGSNGYEFHASNTFSGVLLAEY